MELQCQEEKPLRADSFKVREKSGWQRFQERFFSKAVIATIVVLLIILVILVIVLGALLGKERASRGDEKSGTYNPEAQNPTASPGPTNPGTEIWWNVRLPKYIVPRHYEVTIFVDLRMFRLSGHVNILLDVKQSTEYVLVHTNNLNVTSVAVHKAMGGIQTRDERTVKNPFWFKKNQFYVLPMESVLEPGEYLLKMVFESELRAELGGFYRIDYKKKDGTSVAVAATQFSPGEARKAFPCFDEPAMKATFNVTLVHDPKLIALSNMPVYHSEERDGWKYDHFQKSVVMSTYLVAFAVCDFAHSEFIAQKGIKVGMYTPQDRIDQVGYASKITDELFTYFEDYFQIEYSLPKCDMIAIPNFIYGGMENWGLITYRDWNLLFKPNVSSAFNKQRVAEVVTHELAHQWFGNLVTMEWWDDIWLNEGFASFLEFPAMDHIHPDWKMDDQIVVLDMASAFSLDGMSSSHPLRIPITRPEEVNQVLDYITYEKGSSILRMLESFISKEILRKGLTRYLKAFEYGNAKTEDLWEAFRKESCVQGKCVDVKHMMDTWTLQMGYPVVNIRHSGGDQYLVSQERFLYDPNTNVTSKYQSPFDYKWFVPFTYLTSSAPKTPKTKELNMTAETITWDGNGWIKGNAGQKGFYRVNYDDNNWNALASALTTNHKVFNVSDRGGVIDDAFELARSGRLNYTKALEMTSYLGGEEEYVPWAAALKNFKFIKNLLSPTRPAYKYLQAYLELTNQRYLLYQAEPQYRRLGLKDQGSHLESMMRPSIAEVVCGAGEKTCLSNASKYFRDWMKDPVNNPVPANFRTFVYLYGISSGGREDWDFAFQQFLQTSVASESRKLIHGLASSSEPWILKRFLEYSLDPSKIKSQDTTNVIGSVAENSAMGRQMAWDFMLKHWQTLENRYGEGLYVLRRLLESVTKGFTNEFQLDQLLTFVKQRYNDAEFSGQLLLQAVERVKSNIEWIKRNEKDLENWLKGFLSKTGELKKMDPKFSDPARR